MAMNVVVELTIVIFKVLWFSLVALFKVLVPAKFQSKKNVRGHVVLVTGAGSGLGRLISLRFAGLGSQLVLWDIDEKGNKETAKLVKAACADVATYTVDLSNREQIYSTANKVKQEVGDVDILVNNAGIVTGKKFLDSPDELIQKTMDVNCNAHFWTTKAFLPAMLARNHGHIVTIASGAGLFGIAGLCDYCASKFAAVGFDETLRSELKKQGKTDVHTTVVCPSFINTGMFAGVQSRFPFILPILEPDEVVGRIMDSVLTNQEILIVPRLFYFLLFLKGFLPIKVTEVLANFFGANDSMDDFVGRSKSR